MISPSSRIIHPFFIRWNARKQGSRLLQFLFLAHVPPTRARREKKKEKKKSWAHEFYECCSHRGNEFPATKLSASIERWPQLAIISSLIPSNILLPSFRSFLSRTRGCVLKVSRRTRRGRILFFSIIFFNLDIFKLLIKVSERSLLFLRNLFQHGYIRKVVEILSGISVK